jgi:DnaK suppressor protein
MDGIDQDAARAVLIDERSRRVAELGVAIDAPGQMTYGSQAAAASQVFAQQRDLALRDRAQAQLELVDAALARLDGGTFGLCIRCGNTIPAARLEALPWAATCIECARLVGQERR